MGSGRQTTVTGLFTCEVNLFQWGSRQRIWSSSMERSRAALRVAFPERQILIRTDGRVRFFVFGPLLQITL